MQRFSLPLWLNETGALAPGHNWPVAKRGDWYCLGDRGCRLHPDINAMLRVMAATRPDVEIFYGDEVETAGGTADASASPERLVLKPGFDITQLLAQNYIGWPLFIRGDALAKLKPATPDTPLTAYDILLRAHAAGMMIERIPEIVCARRTARPVDDVTERTRAVQDWIGQRLDDAKVLPGRLPSTLRLHRPLEDAPHVTLVIPTR